MATVNRFRLAGIKYDSGKLCYDDKLFQTKDFNIYIDLKNGIGKTFLAQMFLQTILPNSKFEEKKPISLLFNNRNKNKYIHSIVEFKLDEGSPFKYALVGFCAYSKEVSNIEESETYDQGFATLKYICLYNSPNENDIANIPYTTVDKSGNRSVISNKKLETILKNIQNQHRADYIVMINKTIKAHQNELAKLGINAVEFEEMIELNKFEGNAANYLKPYRKGKDFIFKKLIPIVEQSYSLRNSADYESAENRAQTLLTLRETLSKLQLKQSLKDDYEYVETELTNLSQKLEELSLMYSKKEDFIKDLNNYKYLIDTTKINTGKEIDEINNILNTIAISKEEINSEINYISMVRKAIEIEKKDIEISEQSKIVEGLENSIKEKDVEINDKKESIFRAECEKIYKDYKSFKAKSDKAELELESLQKNYEDILVDYNYWGSHFKYLLERAYDEVNAKYKDSTAELDELSTNGAELSEKLGATNATINTLTTSKDELNEKLNSVTSKINSIRSEVFHLDIEELQDEISNTNISLDKLIETSENSKERARDIESNIIKIDNDLILLDERLNNYKNKYTEVSTYLNKYYSELDIANKITEKYPSTDTLSSYLEDSIEKLSYEITDKKHQYEKISDRIEQLKKDKDVSFSEEALKQFEIISTGYKSAILGTSYLEKKTSTEKNELIGKFELLPYSILLNKSDYNKFKIDTVIRRKFNDQIVPVVCSDLLKDKAIIKINDISFTNKDIGYFTDIENRKKEIANLERDLYNITLDIETLKRSKQTLTEDLNKVKIFEDKYNDNDIAEHKKDLTNSSTKLKEIPKEIEKLNNAKDNLEYELDNLNDKIIQYSKEIDETKHLVNQLNDELKAFRVFINLSEELSIIENDISITEKKIAVEKENLEKITSMISENKDNISKISLINSALLSEVKSLEVEKKNLLFHQKESVNIDPSIILEEAKSKFLAYKNNVEGKISDLNQLEEAFKSFNDIANDRLKELKDKNDSANSDKYTLEKLNNIELLNVNYSIYIADLNKKIESDFSYRNKLSETMNDIKGNIKFVGGVRKNLLDTYNKSYDTSYTEALKDIGERSQILNELSKKESILNKKIAEMDNDEREKYSRRGELREFIHELESYDHQLERVALINKCTLIPTEFENKKLNLKDISQCETTSSTINKSLDRSKNLYLGMFDILLGKLDNSNLINFKIDLEYLRRKELTNSSDCKANIEQLIGDNGYVASIKFEMEQVNKEIEGLKKDEETFINQCLQRCEQVHKELQGLTHLSKILINEKKVPLIEVIIKTEEEDIQKAKMKNYINNLVMNLSEIEENKKHEYLADKLRLSSMFAQYVLSANKCDIKVYKAASIAENAEDYYWEELIGSTGQTNGMAYNIFISLLAFIRKLYNPHISDDSRKTILLDAPFSGMVASYIWEPIIKLLDQNNFQIICLGYQLPNNLSPLFQVKVHLEDQMTSSGLSIVVDTVKSEVELDSDNYVRFVGNQIDIFDFE